jgi:hypothetical protein
MSVAVELLNVRGYWQAAGHRGAAIRGQYLVKFASKQAFSGDASA